MTEAAELRFPNIDCWTKKNCLKNIQSCSIFTTVAEEKQTIVLFRPVKVNDKFLVNNDGRLTVEKVANIVTDKNCHFLEDFTMENYVKKYEFRSESDDKLYLGVTDRNTFGLTEKNPRSNTYFRQLECSRDTCIDTGFTKPPQCQCLFEEKWITDLSKENKRSYGETDVSFMSKTDSCNTAFQLFLRPWGTDLVVLYQDGKFEVVKEEFGEGLCSEYNGLAKFSF